MRKVFIFLLILTSALCMVNCNRQAGVPAYRVVVLHSVANEGTEGKPFREYMDKQFREAGIQAEIHHLYLNLVHEPMEYTEKFKQKAYADSISRWNPDVILVNEDLALEWVFRTGKSGYHLPASQRLDKIFKQVPIVIAGITALDKDLYNQYPNMTGFEDVIDLQKNIQIIMQTSGSKELFIEMDDDNRIELTLKKQLMQQLEDQNLYLLNRNYDLDFNQPEKLNKEFQGKVLVTLLSARYPERNRNFEEDIPETTEEAKFQNYQRGTALFRKHLDFCKYPPLAQLQVKYDLYSNTFIEHSNMVQYTCIRRQFNEKSAIMVAGYFSDMETQIKDQVSYATQLLQGTNPKDLALSQHEKYMYMDYNAMQKFKNEPLKYADYHTHYHIINAPFKLRNPILYYSLMGLGILLLLVFLPLVALTIVKFYKRADKDYQEKLKEEDERRNFTLLCAKATLWKIQDENLYIIPNGINHYRGPHSMPLSQFRKYILKDSWPALDAILNYSNQLGQKKFRLHISWNRHSSKHTHWYEISYNVEQENLEKNTLMGIAITIDDVVATEARLNDIQEKIEESEQKQNFLNNISHDLRTPLNAVTGFAQLITTPGMEFAPEELTEFNNAIQENSEMMQKMIQSVIAQSKEDIDHQVIKPIKSSAQLFIKRVYQTHQVLVPSHLKLFMKQDEPDRNIYIDPNKTRQVMNNFVGNAFKFTPQGSITIGWKYLADTQEVLFYCTDTGIGLTEEDRKQVFDRFYKVKEGAVGTGLGLNISRTIIEQQGGSIGVESTLGEGSTFWFKMKEYTGD